MTLPPRPHGVIQRPWVIQPEQGGETQPCPPVLFAEFESGPGRLLSEDPWGGSLGHQSSLRLSFLIFKWAEQGCCRDSGHVENNPRADMLHQAPPVCLYLLRPEPSLTLPCRHPSGSAPQGHGRKEDPRLSLSSTPNLTAPQQHLGGYSCWEGRPPKCP